MAEVVLKFFQSLTVISFTVFGVITLLDYATRKNGVALSRNYYIVGGYGCLLGIVFLGLSFVAGLWT